MIVNNNDPPPPPKPNQNTPLLKDTNMGQPPAYPNQPNQNQSSSGQYYTPVPVYVQHRLPDEADAGKKACRRFTGALFVALLVWMLMSMLAASFSDVASVSWGRWDVYPPSWERHYDWNLFGERCDTHWDNGVRTLSETEWPDIDIDIPDIDIDIPNIDVTIPRGPYSSRLAIDLNLSAISHLFVSENTWGNVRVLADGKAKDKISVDVTAYYYRKGIRDMASVCKIEDGKGGEGVGLYVPRYRGFWWRRREDQVSFSLVVHLPQASSSSPKYINSFEGDLSNFRIQLDELSRAVHFGSLKLRTSNGQIVMPVEGPAVIADDLSLRSSNGAISGSALSPNVNINTSNGRITGSYTTNDTLIIHTSNGLIDITGTLQYSKNTTRKYPTIDLKSSNGRIDAAIHLTNPSSSSNSGGAFQVTTTTSNGAIDLTFPSSPQSSFLKLDSSTSNSRQNVHLNSAFEGTWEVSTSSHIGIPDVGPDNDGSKDPSGEGRKRVAVTKVVTKGYSSGKVSWGEWDGGKTHYGEVKIRTSNGRPVLRY